MATDPTLDPLPRYTFLPWARRGIAAQIDQTDDLAANPASGPAGRATLTAGITVESVPVPGAPAVAPSAITRTVALVGPGDVKAFRPGAVLRTAPVAGALNATPGELAFVEFYDEDFPWRYTPARATADHKLRPWLALLVLAAGEFTLLTRPGELAILVVADDVELPAANETWAWAHVQLSGDLAQAGGLDDFVGAAPDHALARLMSPRRLRPLHDYHGFVVPAFETGRLAGLGTPDATVPAQKPAWGPGQPRRFPVLYDWSWRTSEVSDFESLVRRPKPFVAGEAFGKRALDVSDPGAGLPATPGATVQLEGALQPIDFPRTPYPDPALAELTGAVQGLVDLNVDYRTADPQTLPDDDDPVIAPPAYARLAAGVARVADAASLTELGWLAELNDDVRNRAAAGLGVTLVRQRDDELMARAWAQVEELAAVNQRLREADLAIAASERIFAKHIANAGTDRMLVLTGAAQTAISVQDRQTVRARVDASRVPAAAQTTTFRRISRPQRTLVSALAGDTIAGVQGDLIARLNADAGTAQAVSTAPPAPDPAASVALDAVTAAVDAAAAQQSSQPAKPRDEFLHLARDEVAARIRNSTFVSVSDATGLGVLRTALLARLDADVPAPAAASDPATALRQGVQEIVAGIVRLDPVQLDAQPPDQAVVAIAPAVFAAHFGDGIDGKTYQGVTAAPQGSPLENTSTTTDPAAVATFVTALDGFSELDSNRPPPPPAAALAATDALAARVSGALHPRAAAPARLGTVLHGVGDLPADVARSRRLQPVMAHPRFPDPLFEPLRLLSQDYVLPNISDLQPESIALMQPNDRFIESLLAGASTEMGRELLWNEYPTDQRGTYFSRFWDARDAGVTDPPPDILDLVDWSGALGSQSGRAGSLLVLVVRAELMVKFPDTVVYAQRARFVPDGTGTGRTLDESGDVSYPVLKGRLDPDIALYGFELSPGRAAGDETDAGYFFCFMERPGQIRFGLDLDAPPPPLTTWDDLAWAHLQPADADQVRLAGNGGLVPTTAGLPGWAVSAAHQAAILCQSPVLLARHASDMLPPGVHA